MMCKVNLSLDDNLSFFIPMRRTLIMTYKGLNKKSQKFTSYK